MNTWSNKGEWICPYCGYKYKVDPTEDIPTRDLEFDDLESNCPKCGETYLVKQRVIFLYETSKYPKENE